MNVNLKVNGRRLQAKIVGRARLDTGQELVVVAPRQEIARLSERARELGIHGPAHFFGWRTHPAIELGAIEAVEPREGVLNRNWPKDLIDE